MYQVPPEVWNAIAATGKLQNPSLRILLALPPAEMLEQLHSQEQALEANGVPDSVITSYLTMAPLLAEHEAISQHINETGSYSLLQALPEVLTAQEAVAIAQQDRPLNDSESALLLKMLTRLEPN